MTSGIHVWRDNEKIIDTSRAARAIPREVVRRPLQEAGRRYIAYDAHSLIDLESEADRARPGHPYG